MRQAIGASDSPERVLELFADFVLQRRSGLELVAAVA